MKADSRNLLSAEIDSLRHSLRSLDRSLRRLVPPLTATATNGTQHEQPRRRRRLSAKERASMVLQGRYMGYMRQLKPRQKVQVRRIRHTNGVFVAIRRAKELAIAQR